MKYSTSLKDVRPLNTEEVFLHAIAERLEAIADAVGRVADHLGAQTMAEEQAKLDAIASAAQAQAEEEARQRHDTSAQELF